LWIYVRNNPLRYYDPDGHAESANLLESWRRSDVATTTRKFWVAKYDAAAAGTESLLRDWQGSDIATTTREFWLKTEGRQQVLGAFFGTASGLSPGPLPAPAGLPPAARSTQQMFEFAVRNATVVVAGIKSIQSLPPPGPRAVPALATAAGQAPSSSLPLGAANPAPSPGIVLAAASGTRASGKSNKPDKPAKPKTGERVGDVHPATGHEIIAETTETANTLDVSVEAAKPSQRNRLTRRLLENPGTHDPSGRTPNDIRVKYDPDKAVMPANQADLFKESVEFGGKRYALDEKGNIHQFQPSADDVFHWAGAEGSETAKGASRDLELPSGVRARLRAYLQGRGH
jgi:hypothetical protein